MPTTTRDGDRLGGMLADALGDKFEDLRRTLPRNPAGPYGDFSTRSAHQIAYLAVHHTGGLYWQTWADVARFHVGPSRRWAGIGYHLGIQGGRVSYLGDAGLSRACVARTNHRVLCLCFAGDYHTPGGDEPRTADLDAAAEAVRVVDAWLGREPRLVGHRDMTATACPGDRLYSEVGTLRARAATPGRPGTSLRSRLLAEAEARRVVELYPEAALLRHLLADGFVPVGNEFVLDGDYVAHAAERPSTGTMRVYYAPIADVNAVGFVTR